MKTRKTPENTPWALISSWLYPTEPANAKRYLGAKAEASQEAARKGALPKRAPSLKPGAKEHPLQHSVQPPQQQQPQQQAQCSRVDTKSLETERLHQESRALKLSLGHRRSSSSSNISSSSIQTQAITLPFPPLPLYPTPVSGGENTGFGTIGPQAQGCKGAVWMREAGVVQHQQQQQLCEAHSHGQTSPFDHSRAQHPILASAHPPSSTPSYSLPASKFAPSRPQQPTQEASAQASQQTGTDFVPEGGGRMWPGYTQALHQLQCMQAESRRQQERLLCCAAGSMSNSNKHGEEGSAASCSSCGSGSCSQRGVCGKQWESSWHEQIAHMISQILAQQQLQCDLWDILQMTQQPYLYQQHHQRQQHSQKASSLLQPPDQGVGSNSAESSSARGSEVVGPPRGDSCSWDGPQQEWDSVTSVPVSPPCLAAVNAEGPGLLSLHSQQQQQQSHASSLADKEEQQQQQQQQQQRQQQGQQQQGQAQPKDELLSRKEQGTPQQQQQHQQLENTKQEPEVQLLMQQQILELQLQQNRELHEEQQLLQHNPCTAFQALLMEHVHLEAECEDLKAHILALTDDLHRSQQEAEAGSSATQQLQQVLCALDSSLNDLHTEHAATKAALAAATAENAHLMTLLSSKHEGSCMLLPALGQATAQPVAGQ